MNYRRGFQRVYAALTVVWITVIMFVVLADFWQPWYSPIFNGGWSSTEDQSPLAVVRSEPLPAQTWTVAQQVRRWTWATGLSMVPPLLGYLILFYLLPWIYRGFRSSPP
jgi:hypothetical protein